MKEFDDLVQIFETLRAPGGCPWDARQDHRSISRCIIEEAHELYDAIDREDADQMREELGDVLLQVIFHSIIARDQGEFTLTDVISGLADKLVSRHPHVFGSARADTPEEVKRNRELLKKKEKGKAQRESILDGIPPSLPSLVAARKIQSVVSRVGFDWQNAGEVVDKLEEETRELAEALSAGDAAAVQGEIGDLLFTVVNLARLSGVDPEAALRRTNRKFTRRFHAIEKEARRRKVSLEDMTLQEMDALWERAKGELEEGSP
ncbi:MAG TPA: nucleoside triphosphate pyrophosphohydrolase [Deltaproteobacteria bacterium]|nr:nucleoside triphosphate pyrophosphohydrolase [Deltaproteobacteria bacterium]